MQRVVSIIQNGQKYDYLVPSDAAQPVDSDGNTIIYTDYKDEYVSRWNTPISSTADHPPKLLPTRTSSLGRNVKHHTTAEQFKDKEYTSIQHRVDDNMMPFRKKWYNRWWVWCIVIVLLVLIVLLPIIFLVIVPNVFSKFVEFVIVV